MATHGIDNTLKVPPSPTEPHTTATALMPPQRLLRRRRRPQRPRRGRTRRGASLRRSWSALDASSRYLPLLRGLDRRVL